jgi:hypothetical protein
MRTMVRITMPVETGNTSVRDGSMQKVLADTLERLRPEAAYFYSDRGVRTTLLVLDLKDSSDVPAVAEPFFQQFNAAVEFTPVMNADDLKKALAKLA